MTFKPIPWTGETEIVAEQKILRKYPSFIDPIWANNNEKSLLFSENNSKKNERNSSPTVYYNKKQNRINMETIIKAYMTKYKDLLNKNINIMYNEFTNRFNGLDEETKLEMYIKLMNIDTAPDITITQINAMMVGLFNAFYKQVCLYKIGIYSHRASPIPRLLGGGEEGGGHVGGDLDDNQDGRKKAFKKTIDEDESRQKREDNVVEIRKQNMQSEVMKRRREGNIDSVIVLEAMKKITDPNIGAVPLQIHNMTILGNRLTSSEKRQVFKKWVETHKDQMEKRDGKNRCRRMRRGWVRRGKQPQIK